MVSVLRIANDSGRLQLLTSAVPDTTLLRSIAQINLWATFENSAMLSYTGVYL